LFEEAEEHIISGN